MTKDDTVTIGCSLTVLQAAQKALQGNGWASMADSLAQAIANNDCGRAGRGSHVWLTPLGKRLMGHAPQGPSSGPYLVHSYTPHGDGRGEVAHIFYVTNRWEIAIQSLSCEDWTRERPVGAA